MNLFQRIALLGFGVTAAGASKCPTKLDLKGHIEPDEVMTFVYEPFDVPPGVSAITVRYNYTLKGDGNTLDIGIFDQRGHAKQDPVNGTIGSRGWSGGARDNFTISNAWATPGYNGGTIAPGTWYIVFGPYESTDDGIDWTAHVDFSFDKIHAHDWFTPDYSALSLEQTPVWKVDEQKPRWLRGDFHLHTVYSDGQYLPQDHVDNAIERDLDFIFFSEHNTYSGNDVSGLVQPSDGSLLIGRAIEVTTRYGHWHAIGVERGQLIEWRYTPEDGAEGYPAAAAQVHRVGGVVSVNHPFAPCGRCEWQLDWENNDSIEVWNGPWDPTDQMAVEKWHKYLVEGRRYVAIGGSDAHRSPDVTALPTTVVLARELSQAAIIEGVKQGHAYLVQGPGMAMSLSVKPSGGGTVHIGQAVKGESVRKAKAKLEVDGFGANHTVVSWITEKGPISNVSVTGDSMTLHYPMAKVKSFLRAEVRDGDGNMVGLTNPIFVD